jgi:hypothetical protein
MAQLDGKQWKCPNGHSLGVVERVSFTTQSGHSGHVSRLLLFRQAIGIDEAAEVDVIAAVEGTALNVRCSICGELRPWYIGADALERLLERFSTKEHEGTRIEERRKDDH